MTETVCWKCIEDPHLSRLVRDGGSITRCTTCKRRRIRSMDATELAEIVAPVIEEHFQLGEDRRVFSSYDDDRGHWEQAGEDLDSITQAVTGQYFDFQDELIRAIIDTDDAWPPDGEEPFFDESTYYEPKEISAAQYFLKWQAVLLELKHERRFFNSTAADFFRHLFRGISDLHAWSPTTQSLSDPVIQEIASGTKIYRARVCRDVDTLNKAFREPQKYIGPPPPELASAGRMNPEGISVLYSSLDEKTCLAEMRPALSMQVLLVEIHTTQMLRVLDFSRLELATTGKGLSYFQDDFAEEAERGRFLRSMHALISNPIVPGKESDYVITQTMVEYLANVHSPRFDGIIYGSAQRRGGLNMVLFRKPGTLELPLEYLSDSVKLFATTEISYSHVDLLAELDGDEVRVYGREIEGY